MQAASTLRRGIVPILLNKLSTALQVSCFYFGSIAMLQIEYMTYLATQPLLPAMVALDGFVVSHTQMIVDFPEQELVDRYLPHCDVPHRLSHDHPQTIGGLTWPRETVLISTGKSSR